MSIYSFYGAKVINNQSMVITYLKLLRPVQWLKNLMLFFPSFLGGGVFTILKPSALLPFAAFCMASSASYIINDCRDRIHDRHHPEKMKRPIASGHISIAAGGVTAILLLIAAFALAWYILPQFCNYVALYFLVSLAYTFWLKSFVLLDIVGISAGFIIRLAAGGAVFSIPISTWLFLCVFLLSLFLSAGKRLGEKQRLGDKAIDHRKALVSYSGKLLERIMLVTGGSVLVAYTMYIISKNSKLLLCTVPLCLFGLLRYHFKIHTVNFSGDPTESLTRDVPLFITGALWTIMAGWGIYG